uniref:Uncharacterized protein n=1 Tax=Cacopsylla melanoneura TaxID=428564 RepID=A0A8D8YSS2_9HEMI
MGICLCLTNGWKAIFPSVPSVPFVIEPVVPYFVSRTGGVCGARLPCIRRVDQIIRYAVPSVPVVCRQCLPPRSTRWVVTKPGRVFALPRVPPYSCSSTPSPVTTKGSSSCAGSSSC